MKSPQRQRIPRSKNNVIEPLSDPISISIRRNDTPVPVSPFKPRTRGDYATNAVSYDTLGRKYYIGCDVGVTVYQPILIVGVEEWREGPNWRGSGPMYAVYWPAFEPCSTGRPPAYWSPPPFSNPTSYALWRLGIYQGNPGRTYRTLFNANHPWYHAWFLTVPIHL